jgi:hypothetical protein
MTNPAGVKTVALVERQEAEPEAGGLALVIERLAANPSVDVAKLEKIIDLQERVVAHQAKAAFDAAFVQMRPNIPVILERARTDKTTYAPLEDIIEAVAPILSHFGFSLSFETAWPGDQVIEVIGILTHQQGHERRSRFQAKADKSGSKNEIQALGSTVSYGKRYTTNDLLSIVTRGQDTDGYASQVRQDVKAPAGFESWRRSRAERRRGGAISGCSSCSNG